MASMCKTALTAGAACGSAVADYFEAIALSLPLEGAESGVGEWVEAPVGHVMMCCI